MKHAPVAFWQHLAAFSLFFAVFLISCDAFVYAVLGELVAFPGLGRTSSDGHESALILIPTPTTIIIIVRCFAFSPVQAHWRQIP